VRWLLVLEAPTPELAPPRSDHGVDSFAGVQLRVSE
jgi:hypothetical protein